MIKLLAKAIGPNGTNGEFFYYFNDIKIGSHHLHSDFIIKDILPIHLVIKINNQNIATISSFKEDTAFLLNGKKVIGKIVLKNGDNIQLGDTLITITEVSYTQSYQIGKNKEEIEDTLITYPVIGEILSEIQTEIIKCEKLINE